MPFDPTGKASLPPSTWATPGQTIRTEQHNPPFRDIEAMLSAVLKRDGRDGMVGPLRLNGFKATGLAAATDPEDAVTLSQVMSLIAQTRVPVGVAQYLTGVIVPSGWVLANGQSLSRTDYADLWGFAQTSGNLAATEGDKTAGQYGPGNGTTTFTLPNLEADGGYFIRPVSSSRGIGSVQADEIKSHGHSANVTDPGHFHSALIWRTNAGGIEPGASVGYYGQASTSSSKTGISVSVSASGGTETRPKNIAYPVIIKA